MEDRDVSRDSETVQADCEFIQAVERGLLDLEQERELPLEEAKHRLLGNSPAHPCGEARDS